jgi:hypothetical protein
MVEIGDKIMPLPLIAVAVPVIHSAGGYIAFQGAGYIGGTYATTWLGAFVLGNSTLLGALGFTSLAGIGTAMFGGGAIATALGLAAPTMLGLTAAGWATGGVGVAIAGVAYTGYSQYRRSQAKAALVAALPEINKERAVVGDYPLSYTELVEQLKAAEKEAYENSFEIATRILAERANDDNDFTVRSESAIDVDALDSGDMPSVEVYVDHEWESVRLGDARLVVDHKGERIMVPGYMYGDTNLITLVTVEELEQRQENNKDDDPDADQGSDA